MDSSRHSRFRDLLLCGHVQRRQQSGGWVRPRARAAERQRQFKTRWLTRGTEERGTRS